MSTFGIFSDVHGNVDALSAVLDAYDERGAEELICLGDTVGYGGDPRRCCELVAERARTTVCGNHDAAVAGTMGYEYYYGSAKQALDAHRNMLSEEHIRWLKTLPYTHRDSDYDILFSHGSPVRPRAFEYIFEPEHVESVAYQTDEPARVSFIGHSHLTRSFRFRFDDEDLVIEEVSDHRIELEPDWKYVVTVGSVGQPRDNDARARAAIYESDEETIDFLYIDYDIARAAERIIQHGGLATAFAKRLFLGV